MSCTAASTRRGAAAAAAQGAPPGITRTGARRPALPRARPTGGPPLAARRRLGRPPARASTSTAVRRCRCRSRLSSVHCRRGRRTLRVRAAPRRHCRCRGRHRCSGPRPVGAPLPRRWRLRSCELVGGLVGLPLRGSLAARPPMARALPCRRPASGCRLGNRRTSHHGRHSAAPGCSTMAITLRRHRSRGRHSLRTGPPRRRSGCSRRRPLPSCRALSRRSSRRRHQGCLSTSRHSSSSSSSSSNKRRGGWHWPGPRTQRPALCCSRGRRPRCAYSR